MAALTQSHRQLIELAGDFRPMEPHLTGFPGGPWQPGAVPRSLVSWREVGRQIEREAQGGATASERAARRHAAAVWALLNASSPEKLERAVTLLVQVIELLPERTEAWVDLSATYLERGRLKGWLDDAARALEATQRALELEPGNQAALFNQELALVRLGGKLDRSEVGTDSLAAQQERALDELLLLWLRGDSRGGLQLQSLAHDLEEQTHDPLLSEVLAGISGADPVEHLRLAQALESYAEGRKSYKNREIPVARTLFATAFKQLEAQRSPLALWAAFWSASSSYRESQPAEAERQLRQLAPLARRFPILATYVDWMLALTISLDQRFDEAMAIGARAAESFERLGAFQEAGFQWVIQAQRWGLAGDQREVWDCLTRALATLKYWTNCSFRAGAFDELATASGVLGTPEAQQEFLTSALREALNQDNPAVIVTAFAKRARFFASRELHAEAQSDIADARRWLARIPNPRNRKFSEVEILLAEANLAENQAELDDLTKAIERLEEQRIEVLLVELYTRRGELRARRDDYREAARDFEAAIALVEKGGAEIRGEALRSSFAAVVRRAHDGRIRLALDVESDSDKAFLFAERARANEHLTGRVKRAVLAELSGPEDAQRYLPRDTGAIFTWVLQDRLLLWLVTTEETHFISQRLKTETLGDLVQSYVGSLSQGKLDNNAARTLYRLLWKPLERQVTGLERLLIAADRPLDRLPFAGLYDSAQEQFLVERHSVAKFFGLGLLVSGESQPSSSEPDLLVLGDPAFDNERFPELGHLSQARAESEEIASLYTKPTILSGKEATKEHFLDEIDKHTIAHIASHAVADPERPSRSFFALAPSSQDSGALYSYEVEQLPLRRVRMVVLSACKTTGETSSASVSLSGLARPFLAAGASAVVATHWSIEDSAAGRLMPLFHRELLESWQRPDKAMRAAQLALAMDPESSPAAWAGFEVFLSTID